jgi:hypothetical protein
MRTALTMTNSSLQGGRGVSSPRFRFFGSYGIGDASARRTSSPHSAGPSLSPSSHSTQLYNRSCSNKHTQSRPFDLQLKGIHSTYPRLCSCEVRVFWGVAQKASIVRCTQHTTPRVRGFTV